MSGSRDEAQLDIIFYYGAYPLWQFLTRKFGLDMREVCPRVAVEEPVLTTPAGAYRMQVVDMAHENEFSGRDADHDSHLTFLLNSVNVVFNVMKDGIIRDGDHILRPYRFHLTSGDSLVLQLSPEDIVDGCSYAQSLDDSIKLGVVFEAIKL